MIDSYLELLYPQRRDQESCSFMHENNIGLTARFVVLDLLHSFEGH